MLPRHLLPLLAAAAAFPAVLEAVRTLTREPPPGRPEPDLLARLQPMRAHLEGVPLVCYLPRDFAAVLTDPARSPAAATRANLELYLAQRALAPTLVRFFDVDAGAWTLGNFADAGSVPADWRERGLELVADLGNGVVLWKPKGR